MITAEKLKSGIPEMDEAFDYIRMGDNVVWQVTDLHEFKTFVKPYVEQALLDHNQIVYIRFAMHEPLVEQVDGVKIIEVPLSHRFENFTVQIHNIIKAEGKEALYVFDCLSELQTAWSTDLMMGNFFRVTCPYLFQLDTVAYFPLIRGMHSFKAIDVIRETTQLFLDVYSDALNMYVRPLKVWNRESDTMLAPHIYNENKGTFRLLTEGVMVSHFYHTLNRQQTINADLNIDSWDRFFALSISLFRQGMDVTENCNRICDIMMSRDEKIRKLIKENFTPEDYFEIRGRMIGTGLIGGKACGMLIARKLIENQRPDLYEHLEPHDSFYIGSDVFYSYIVYNGFWDIRIRQRTEKEYFSLADTFADHINQGCFSESHEKQFLRILDYYGQDPFIVRSSSILEDGFGNAFAGKYESVFCANTGTREERLHEFEKAIKIVYASTTSRSALEYRFRRGLELRDEQMALLVQRVSGCRYKDFFMPNAAGVGYSYSPYRFMEKMNPNAGMLRLVMGLGTGAVDRTQGSYPRLVNLDDPTLTAAVTISEKHRYSQRKVDVLDLVNRQIVHQDIHDVEQELPYFLTSLLLEHDYDAERMFRERGQNQKITFISCEGLVKKQELMNMMKDIMHLIQEAYEYPVDIEYTMNFSEAGEYVVNLLQCRPLQIENDAQTIHIPDNIKAENILLKCKKSSMGLSQIKTLDAIVYIDPVKYYEMNYNDKYEIRTILGEINWYFRNKGKSLALFTPGRIGTSSPELGVPTSFADISEFCIIAEVSDDRAGYMPELSYGSHIFQDLVEAHILYGAVFQNEKTEYYQPRLLENMPNHLTEVCPHYSKWESVVRLCMFSQDSCMLYHDLSSESLLIEMST